jgi:MFS transporter, DHA2 family, multidrug resistance protein
LQGKPSNIALLDAYKVMDLKVTKQAMVLSYMDVFLFTGVIFLICIPFVMMVRGNKGKKIDMSEAMH